MWYDAARTRYEPPYVATWTRVVPAAPATLSNGTRYASVEQKVVVDCSSQSWAVIHSDFYASAEGGRLPVYSFTVPREQWELRTARRESNAGALMRVVCSVPKPW
jgi:hypothetical protein